MNIHVRDGITEDEFVDLRQKRDAGLDMPDLLIPSIQVNMRAGHFPEAEAKWKHLFESADLRYQKLKMFYSGGMEQRIA